MKRKDYQKPTMQVVKMENKCQILAASQGINASRKSYGEANHYTWGDGGDAE